MKIHDLTFGLRSPIRSVLLYALLLGCATFLALVTSCQSPDQDLSRQDLGRQTSADPTLPIVVDTPRGGEAPVLTPFPYETVDNFGQAKSDKLSGIIFYPRRKTLFAVSDNGRIIELKTDGTLIQRKQIRKKADFEGITYSPATGMLYVAIEGEEIILEVNPETLEAARDIPIDRMFEGGILLSPEGNGIEGITFVPTSDGATNGSFYLVNQSDELGGTDPSIVFEVEINHAAPPRGASTTNESKARIIRYFSVGVTDLSGIHYVPSSHRLLIISDANNLLLEVSLTGQVLETYPLPGKKQEGITRDEEGSLYIAQDTKEALLKFTPLDNTNNTNR